MKPKASKTVVTKASKTTGPSKGKLYQSKLAELDLPAEPVMPNLATIEQFQLAQLAATLANGADPDMGAGKLTSKALQVWKAAGKTLVTTKQAETLAKGLLVMDRNDWEIHALPLIASMDDLDGAVLGQNPNEQINESREKARVNAGLAVSQAWKIGPVYEDTLRFLFPGKAETVESRKNNFFELVAYGEQAAENSDEIHWHAKDGNKLKSSILSAWAPLGLPDDKAMDMALVLLDVFLKKHGEIELTKNMVACSPLLARWFAVMRQEQLSAAKNRA